jgi:hypothetical protein
MRACVNFQPSASSTDPTQDRVSVHLQIIVNAECVADVLPVEVDRPHAEPERFRDLVRVHPLRDHPHNLLLPLRQPAEAHRIAVRSSSTVAARA